MTARKVPHPILDSLSETPKEHWRISELEPPERVGGRHPRSYRYRKPGREGAHPDSPARHRPEVGAEDSAGNATGSSEYRPDFLVRLNGGSDRYLILETKGFDRLGEVKRQAAERWVRAVNNDGRYGSWAYELVTDIGAVGETVTRAAREDAPP